MIKILIFACLTFLTYGFLNDTELREASFLSYCAYCSKSQLIPFKCGYCNLVKSPIKIHDSFEHSFITKEGEKVITYVYVGEMYSRRKIQIF